MGKGRAGLCSALAAWPGAPAGGWQPSTAPPPPPLAAGVLREVSQAALLGFTEVWDGMEQAGLLVLLSARDNTADAVRQRCAAGLGLAAGRSCCRLLLLWGRQRRMHPEPLLPAAIPCRVPQVRRGRLPGQHQRHERRRQLGRGRVCRWAGAWQGCRSSVCAAGCSVLPPGCGQAAPRPQVLLPAPPLASPSTQDQRQDGGQGGRQENRHRSDPPLGGGRPAWRRQQHQPGQQGRQQRWQRRRPGGVGRARHAWRHAGRQGGHVSAVQLLCTMGCPAAGLHPCLHVTVPCVSSKQTCSNVGLR